MHREAGVKWVVRLLREPLLHFLVLAAGLFMLSKYWGDTPKSSDKETIVVSEAKIRSLAHIWQKTWQRPPTHAELQGLIDDYVDEEVFYRQALAMGLDREDTIIRRRLRQKLEFVAEDLADAVEPTDQQLQQYLDDHPDAFRLEQRATFRQIYLSPERRGEALEEDIRQLLDKLNGNDDSVDAADLGDPSLLSHFHKNLRESEIANLFGREFAAGLFAVEDGRWVGPVESGYGVHLVLLHERTAGRLPELADVHEGVRREWYAARRATSKDDFYQGLRQRYEVVVQMPKETDVDATPGTVP